AATMSIGEAIGLHTIPDRLALRSAVALLVDANTGEVLYDKNSRAVLPIASITKLMTAMVVLDARQSLDEPITILDADRDTERFSASRLPVGSRLTRRELLHLALMSSENRAASALARNYPGGMPAFVAAANQKAADIGMRDSVFRSEEHTSELQSRENLVCRLLLEKKNKNIIKTKTQTTIVIQPYTRSH